MRRYIILILSLITIITMTFAQEEISIAKDFVYLMSQGDYEKTVGYFDSSVSAVISSSLKEIWESLIKGVGNYEGIIEERTEESGNYKIIYLTTKFSNAYIDIKMVFLNKNIVGLFFLPAQIKSFNTPPPYVNLEAFEEKDLKIGKDFVLPGKLTIPKGEGPFPVVIFVHGSGPNDMDETIGPNKIFRDLAWGLSSFGIATLRYDKRTKVYPQEFSKYEDGFTVMEEVIEDVLYAIEFVKTQEEIDKSKIFILGHSLGGMLAPRIASLSKDVKGIIIMAGPTRPLEDLIWEQINYIANLDGKIDEKEKEQLELIKKEIEKLKDPEIATKYPLSMNILGAPVKYFLDLKNHDPVKTLSELNISAIIMQGERDYQVTIKDFEGWSVLSNKENITLKLYPKLNHLFMEGTGKSTPDEYNKVGNIPEYVIKDIALWIKDQK